MSSSSWLLVLSCSIPKSRGCPCVCVMKNSIQRGLKHKVIGLPIMIFRSKLSNTNNSLFFRLEKDRWSATSYPLTSQCSRFVAAMFVSLSTRLPCSISLSLYSLFSFSYSDVARSLWKKIFPLKQSLRPILICQSMAWRGTEDLHADIIGIVMRKRVPERVTGTFTVIGEKGCGMINLGVMRTTEMKTEVIRAPSKWLLCTILISKIGLPKPKRQNPWRMLSHGKLESVRVHF